MAPKYDFNAIEEKWRKRWDDTGLYKTAETPKKKFYVLVMFAYPSGDIHMGHFRNYSIGDAAARFRMQQGYDVLHPFGWDAFGLPAEQAAIKRNIHPREWTLGNIAEGRETLKKMAISYDWDREVITCEPDYYRWTQWLFLLLYKRGLAYQAPSAANWCETCKTILANEQCKDGKCWKCDNEVGKKDIDNCWFFKYTDYAQRLLDDIDSLKGWPENVKAMQRHWIGRSEGCEIDFDYEGETLTVFTTRPDTVWGVTFMVVAPEHPIAQNFAKTKPEVAAYIKNATRKSEIERAGVGEKDGVNTGATVTNPLNGETVQLWIADYVVAGYGTGVVMGVPAHDTRDFAFAKKYDIPIRVVIHPKGETFDPATMEDAYVDDGIMVNSGELDGTASPSEISRVIDFIKKKNLGRNTINYRLKDWLVSRQRYWGCPIPIIHCKKCGPQAVPEKDLPVVLPPDQKNFLPQARSPLADNTAYMKATCPQCGETAQRDADTMDTFMCSSYYLFRYLDPNNENEPWRRSEADKWNPVDLYIGGIEHACMHLLYFRFITKVLYDAGHIPNTEPVDRLFNHGMVYDSHGEIMSKSKGNVVSPGDTMAKWGVDATRLAMFRFAPSGDEIPWKSDGLIGSNRFVLKIWDRVQNIGDDGDNKIARRKLHQAIRRMTRALEGNLALNTSLSAIDELLNATKSFPKDVAEGVVQLIAPLAPFMAEELWEMLGHKVSVFKSGWPKYDEALAKEDEIKVVVQVNGKVRGHFTAAHGTADAELEKQALAVDAVQKQLNGNRPRKVIVIKGKLVNIVV